MNNELYQPMEILIKEKKQQTKGFVTQTVLFSRFKIMEVKPDLNEKYYLLFYKNDFIYGEKLASLEKGSFIEKAYREGITIDSHHPFLSVLSPDKTLTVPNKNILFSQLQRHYSPIEIAHIATALDSFFPKDQLTKVLDKIYYHYRRNGNFLKAFQILRILTEFAPELSSASDSIHSQEFRAYDDFYTSSPLSLIYPKDPLFVEFYCFLNRNKQNEYNILVDILKKQNSLLDVLMLWLEKTKKSAIADSLEEYTALGLQFVSMEEWMLTLCDVKVNPFRELPNMIVVVKKMISEGRYETAALYLLNYIDDLPDVYEELLPSLWNHLDTEFIVSHLEGFLKMFQYKVDKVEHVEQKLVQLVGKLLEHNNIQAVCEKLQPIQRLAPNSLVMKKIGRMSNLLEDPDHMMELGQYYAEFKQYDEAIDCFSWEMELHPEDSSPVWELSKMYQYKGMKEEAIAYQQVYTQLKENQRTG